MKKVLYLIIAFCFFLSACKWFKTTPEVGKVLSEHFKDKLYKDFDTAEYNVVFNRHFDSLRSNLNNSKVIELYYANKAYRTNLVTRFYANGQLDTLQSYLAGSAAHGFNPQIFDANELKELLARLSANKFHSIADVYPVIADLELISASSLLKYDTFIGYGAINPKKLLSRYYVTTTRPDNASMDKVLDSKDLTQLLRDIQPQSANYKALQQTLANLQKDPSGNAEKIKTVAVNLERLRWQIPGIGAEFVEVNIPDFSLTWFNKQDTVIHMKVCVGGRREEGYEDKMKVYQVSQDLNDKPKNHQTPILLSTFNAIQANPIWNIPVSIAQTEIYNQASRDPYYLSNSNMKVYYKGNPVADPDTIQWNKYSRSHLPFTFKQGSGNNNALGKFKFIFDNGSSIYLHDTNNKSAFNQSNRAISHGCVRVEKPLDFAEKLVTSPDEFDQLRMEVGLPPIDTTKNDLFKKKLAKKADTVNVFQLKPKWFSTRKNISVFINYRTAWLQNGEIQYRADIYGLDDTIFDAMKKFR